MRVEDVKIGMKVVPHSKSIWGNLEHSCAWNEAKILNQPYLYVIYSEKDYFVLGHKKDFPEDFFLASEFEPYVEEIKIENVEFKVGDWVQIRDDLVEGKKYDGIHFQKHMAEYQRKIMKIIDIDTYGNCRLENKFYFWSKEMLKPISQPIITNNTYSVETTSTTVIKDLNNQIIHTKPEQIETVKTIVNDNCVIVILKDGSKGISKCGKKDKFDFDRGYQIAYLRAKQISDAKKLEELVDK